VRAQVALLLATTLLLTTSGAVSNILDDDAGSGGDAPGTGEGLFIGPGTYSGRLTLGLDAEDRYAFDAALGDIVILSFAVEDGVRLTPVQMLVYRPDGTLVDGVAPWGAQLTPDMAGRWSLRVDGRESAEYSWSLAISHHSFSRTIISRTPWTTVELSQSLPGFLFLQVTTALPLRTGASQRTMHLMEIWGESEGTPVDRARGVGTDTDIYGNAIAVGQNRFTMPTVDAETGSHVGHNTLSADGFQGSGRIVAISSQERQVSITIVSDQALDTAVMSGSEVIHWRASDNGTILAPGVHGSHAESRSFTQDGSLVGSAFGFVTNLTVEAPNGRVYPDWNAPSIGARSQLGPWTVRAPPRMDVGVTDGTYFLGANVPSLGIHAPPRVE